MSWESLAERQLGTITRPQLHAIGLTGGEIDHLRDDGALAPVARSVYRVPGAPRSWEQRVVLAWLSGAGRSDAAGHVRAVGLETAAALHGLHGFRRTGTPVIVVSRRGSARNRLARVVTSTDLEGRHCSALACGPIATSVGRTVLDLALSQRVRGRTERIVDRSLLDKRTTVPELWDLLLEVAGRGKRGVRVLRQVLLERSGAYIPPESELEHRALEALAAAGLPPPVRQHPLPAPWLGAVDLAYPDATLLVELDGASHLQQQTRRRDYERDVAAITAGWQVLRFDWSHVTFRTSWFVESVREVRRQRLAVAATR